MRTKTIGEFKTEESALIAQEVLALFFNNIPTQVIKTSETHWKITATSTDKVDLTDYVTRRMQRLLEYPDQRHEIRIYVSPDQVFEFPEGKTAQERIYKQLNIPPPGPKGGRRKGAGAYWTRDSKKAKAARAKWYASRWPPERRKQ